MDHNNLPQNNFKKTFKNIALVAGVYTFLIHPLLYVGSYFGAKKAYKTDHDMIGDGCTFFGRAGPGYDIFALNKARHYYARSQGPSARTGDLETAIKEYNCALLGYEDILKHLEQDVANAYSAICDYAERKQEQTPESFKEAAIHYQILILNSIKNTNQINYYEIAPDTYIILGKLYYLAGDSTNGLELFKKGIELKGEFSYQLSKVPPTTPFDKLMRNNWLHHLSQKLKSYLALCDELFTKKTFSGTTQGDLHRNHPSRNIEQQHRAILQETANTVIEKYRQIETEESKKN